MGLSKLPPHKMAAAKKLAEKEKAKQDAVAVAEYQPPHKAAAARKLAEKEREKAEKPLADEAQAKEEPTAEKEVKVEKVGVPKTVATIPQPPSKRKRAETGESSKQEKGKEESGYKTITTVGVYQGTTPEREQEMALVLLDIAEIEQDIKMAKLALSAPPTLMLCDAPEVYEEDEEVEINERDAYQVAYGRPFRLVKPAPWWT